MKKIANFALIMTIATLVYVNVFALDSRLNGKWELEVYDLNNAVIAELLIEFTTDNAESCSGGDWKKIKVISSSPQKNQFYPDASMMILHQELSYQLSSDTLAIGRNNICDAYKHLTGKLINAQASGKYVAFGWEREELGSFSIKRLGT